MWEEQARASVLKGTSSGDLSSNNKSEPNHLGLTDVDHKNGFF